MGYRSDVAAVFMFDNTEDRQVLVDYIESHRKELDDLCDCFNFKHDPNKICFYVDSVKWYEDIYPEVIAFNNIVEFAISSTKLTYWEFYRLGEDIDDAEYTWEGTWSKPSGIQLARHLIVDWEV